MQLDPKGKGDARGICVQAFLPSFPSHERSCKAQSSGNIYACVWCSAQGNLLETQCPRFLLGSSPVGTLCWACIQNYRLPKEKQVFSVKCVVYINSEPPSSGKILYLGTLYQTSPQMPARAVLASRSFYQ